MGKLLFIAIAIAAAFLIFENSKNKDSSVVSKFKKKFLDKNGENKS